MNLVHYGIEQAIESLERQFLFRSLVDDEDTKAIDRALNHLYTARSLAATNESDDCNCLNCECK